MDSEQKRRGRRLVISDLAPIHIVRLTKLPLALLITVSALFGLAFANPSATAKHYAILFIGSLWVVVSGAMLNNVQDKELDKLMERTKVRPLPSGIYSSGAVQKIAILIMLAGFGLLAMLPHGIWVVAAAGFGIILYNVIYTPLKRRSLMAIFPGALCGVVPPVMGWIAGNGSLFTINFVALIAVLFAWQMPHFWLILLFRRLDYQSAGLPNFLERFGENALKRMIFVWLLAFSLILSTIAASSTVSFASTRIFVLANSCAIAISAFYTLLRASKKQEWRALFIHLNATLGLVMLVVILEKTFL